MEKVIIAVIYMVGMLFIGYLAYKKVKNFEDYTVAGRGIPFWRNVHSISASAIGAGATMGTASLVYVHGVSGLWLGIGAVLGLLFCGIFLASKLRQTGLITVPDIMNKRYGKTVSDWITILNLFTLFSYVAAQIRALGTITQSFIDVPLLYACIIMGTVTIIYTVLGGLFAATFTDSINMIIMIIAVMVIMPILGIVKTGGFAVMATELEPSKFNMLGMGIIPILGLLMYITPTNFVSQENFLRIAGAKNSKEAKGATITASLLVYFPYFLATMIIGLVGATLFPNLENPDAVFPEMISRLTTPFVGGILLSGLLAAVVSTSGSMLLITSVNVSNNVIKRFKPDMEDKKLMVVSRISVVFVGLIGIIMANFGTSIVGIMQDISAPYISAILPIIIGAFFSKRANATSAKVTIIVALLTSTGWWILKQPYGIHHVIFSLVCSSIAMIVTTIVAGNKNIDEGVKL